MRPLDEMSDHELARFERQLRHDVDEHSPDRRHPSKRRRSQRAKERDQIAAQLEQISSEWGRRKSKVKS